MGDPAGFRQRCRQPPGTGRPASAEVSGQRCVAKGVQPNSALNLASDCSAATPAFFSAILAIGPLRAGPLNSISKVMLVPSPDGSIVKRLTDLMPIGPSPKSSSLLGAAASVTRQAISAGMPIILTRCL